MKFFSVALLSLTLLLPISSEALELGVNVPILRMKDSDRDIAIQKMKELKIKEVRIDIPWQNIEKSKGVYSIPKDWVGVIDELIKNGISPVLILDYGNSIYGNQKPIRSDVIEGYKKYVSFVVKSFQGKVYYYEIWNEWDSHLGGAAGANVEQYINLVEEVAPIIKNASSKNKVIAGSFTYKSFDKELDVGASDENRVFLSSKAVANIDYYSIHPYLNSRIKSKRGFENFSSQIKYINYLLDEYHIKHIKIFITEMGWSTANSGYGVSEDIQSKYLSDAICVSKKLGVEAFFIYDLKNDLPSNGIDGNNAGAYGLFNYDWSDKVAVKKITDLSCL